jgi:hypothetical protein
VKVDPRICAVCRDPLAYPHEPGTYRLVTGWVELRDGGGGHAIRLPEPPVAFAHHKCIEDAVKRVNRGLMQESLFPELDARSPA